MVQGAINTAGRSPLVRVQNTLNANYYVSNFIQPHILPFIAAPEAPFQQDNAQPYVSSQTSSMQTMSALYPGHPCHQIYT